MGNRRRGGRPAQEQIAGVARDTAAFLIRRPQRGGTDRAIDAFEEPVQVFESREGVHTEESVDRAIPQRGRLARGPFDRPQSRRRAGDPRRAVDAQSRDRRFRRQQPFPILGRGGNQE